jgi:hypothetical protein
LLGVISCGRDLAWLALYEGRSLPQILTLRSITTLLHVVPAYPIIRLDYVYFGSRTSVIAKFYISFYSFVGVMILGDFWSFCTHEFIAQAGIHVSGILAVISTVCSNCFRKHVGSQIQNTLATITQ